MKELKNIYDDHDFVCGTMSNCGGEDAWRRILDFITFAKGHGETVTSDDVLALSLSLGEKNDMGEQWYSKHKKTMIASL